MLSPDRVSNSKFLTEAAADYDVVRRAIGHIRGHWREQPEIETIAEAAGVTPTELHHLFRRWAGITPKAFLQALTLDGARQLLRDSASVLDATYEVGLSGPGRLHDLFVTHEAMSPGEWKSGGEGLTVRFGFHPSPFGRALGHGDRARAGRPGLCRRRRGARRARRHEGPLAEGHLRRGHGAHRAARAAHFRFQRNGAREQPLRVVLIGTDFEVRVWEALAAHSDGQARDLFRHRRPRSARRRPRARSAPPSARTRSPSWCPCHRVVGKSGELTGYHWGLTRKRAMLGWEAGQVGAAA